ncbi:MAG TPA: aminotransferase class I/II-fold pyridoxal phosphate-dependent enzyme [Vicinamibacterales bacterium]|nr:aminotransferase class I/II-fold pyridoxal phosphate-dependent enzyme [Vicinamibacterales bacterium]
MAVSRRRFVGGIAAALGYLGAGPELDLVAQQGGAGVPGQQRGRGPRAAVDLSKIAKINNNENPYGVPPVVRTAMEDPKAWEWANRYGAPDGGLNQAIQELHGVSAEHVILGCGSGELLSSITIAMLIADPKKKVLGVNPTYNDPYSKASQIGRETIRVPLNKDYTQNIPAIIDIANKRAAEIGFIYIVNPNNPTGMIVPKDQIKQLLDGIPADMPVLIDEAYHHFVDSPDYESSMKYVLEGRHVIVCRTFSKIAALAAMRLGYGVGHPELIKRVHTFTTGSQSITVKFGGAASLKDTAGQARTKALNKQVRDDTIAKLRAMGYEVLPSETNFFMVGLKREVSEVASEFQKRDVLVGRPFPPMTKHLRVSVGTQAEMDKFVAAFKEIMATPAKATAGA